MERRVSENDLYELAEWKAQDRTCLTVTGSRILEPSSFAARGSLRVHFWLPGSPREASACDPKASLLNAASVPVQLHVEPRREPIAFRLTHLGDPLAPLSKHPNIDTLGHQDHVLFRGT